MERYSEVVGLPVIFADNGEIAGTVKDIFFCPKLKKVLAFLLDSKGIHIKKRLILLNDVMSIGRDALVIANEKSITDFDKVRGNDEYKYNKRVKGLNIYSKLGENLGIVEDVLFDCKLGIIEGVITSNGLIQDIMHGRNVLPLFGRVEFSEVNLIVGKEAVDEMLNTGGGLKNIIDDGLQKKHGKERRSGLHAK